MESFHDLVIARIKSIPHGKVATYGQIAALAGNPRGARQVVRALHSSSAKEKLPWHRVVNAKGTVSLPRADGYELQRSLLEAEGVEFGLRDTIDLARFRWTPEE
jgi:methylated-DNA-protein-cysteine methyltransferase-like protein